MIKSYRGMKAAKIVNTSSLPVGGYVAKINGAKVKDYDWGQVLVILFDVAEGEYKDFFRQQYDGNTNEDRKWKGTLRLTVPDESSQYFAGNQKAFNNFIYALEDSNSGYHYDCDETHLKNKLLGVIYRNKEFLGDDGSVLTCTECGGVTDVTSIRENTYKPLKDKKLKNRQGAVNNNQNSTAGSPLDDDLPFD